MLASITLLVSHVSCVVM